MMTAASEDGVALLAAIMATLLIAALAGALLMTMTEETAIAGGFRSGAEALYAAEAGIDRCVDVLSATADWSSVVAGAGSPAFTDGAVGARTLADGTQIDLAQAVNLADCAKSAPCSDAEITAVTADRPWGLANPRWVLYGYGPVSTLLPVAATSTVYLIVLAAAAAGSIDSSAPVLALRAEAYGPRGAHRIVEAAVEQEAAGVRLRAWRMVS
jgi:hypothetical protein